MPRVRTINVKVALRILSVMVSSREMLELRDFTMTKSEKAISVSSLDMANKDTILRATSISSEFKT